ncbi:hypothetical protein [Tardiphaga sp.]|uniref:hypothetical protein n=1 Tax=Tardiphaga sp. TaxID=1926292 RepID=UPI00260D8EBD|nr:hypothetical protein [Tardiphaga sp.]MDB5620168.1 hypothetical protein [Tardiphaga sp.]
MAHYCVYFFDRDGHSIKVTDVIVKNDVYAILAARSLLGADDIEIWEHDRKVAEIAGLKDDGKLGVRDLQFWGYA